MVSRCLRAYVLLVIAWGIGCRPPEDAPQQAPVELSHPHVIVYLIDALRADHLGTYGYSRDTSPTIDRLAKQGAVFERAHAHSSWTRPSVASLFTGVLPSRHGAVRRSHVLRRDLPTMATVLKAAGYSTAAFVSNPNVLPVFGFDRGFDTFVDVESISRSADSAMVHEAVFDYLSELSDEKPLFLYIHTVDPHAPYAPPAPFDGRFRTAAATLPGPLQPRFQEKVNSYDGEIAYNDAQLEILLKRLEEKGILDRSLFVLLSDHGEEFGDHGGSLHGRMLYEELLRVPLLMRFPGGEHAGRRVRSLVQLVDILPTVCDVAGIPCPTESEGQSLYPLIASPGQSADSRDAVAELDLDGNVKRSLRRGKFKGIVNLRDQSFSLYDLQSDPREYLELSDRLGEVAEAMELDIRRLDAEATGGLYIDLRNADGLDKSSRIAGEIIWDAGELEEASVDGRSDVLGCFALDREHRKITFDCPLANRPNPIGARPFVLTASTRLRLRFDQAVELGIRATVDGRPITADNWRLGQYQTVANLGTGIQWFASDAASLHLRSLAESARTSFEWPTLHLYSLPEAESEVVEIDPELDARLKALGYIGN